ncbi:MAG: DUF6101 family protein [Beijerinckiaceae bacterium]|nr:DUF6101 family protein [Beijerinckiaceae bacterium]
MNVAFQDIEAPRAAAAYRDARADGGERDVTLTCQQVTIGRRLRGVRMKIRVPVNAYTGVTLGLENTASGRPCYKVSLRHVDADLSVLLLETFDEIEARQMWQGWAQHLSLARMVEGEDGALELFATAQRGVQTFDRSRANVATTRSRGRFARRRRMGVAREAATISEDADENIACE